MESLMLFELSTPTYALGISKRCAQPDDFFLLPDMISLSSDIPPYMKPYIRHHHIIFPLFMPKISLVDSIDRCAVLRASASAVSTAVSTSTRIPSSGTVGVCPEAPPTPLAAATSVLPRLSSSQCSRPPPLVPPVC